MARLAAIAENHRQPAQRRGAARWLLGRTEADEDTKADEDARTVTTTSDWTPLPASEPMGPEPPPLSGSPCACASRRDPLKASWLIIPLLLLTWRRRTPPRLSPAPRERLRRRGRPKRAAPSLAALLLASCAWLLVGCHSAAGRGGAAPEPALRTTSTTLSVGAGEAVEFYLHGQIGGLPHLPVRVQCECLPEPLITLTDDGGIVRVEGARPGRHRFFIDHPSGDVPRHPLYVDDYENFVIIRLDEPLPLARKPMQPASALPDDVVLRYESSCCLGPCVPVSLTLTRTGEVRLVRNGEPSTHRIAPGALRRALRAARSLGLGPSYDWQRGTDAWSSAVMVRHGDGVLRFDWYAGDPRIPRGTRRLESNLRRSLGL